MLGASALVADLKTFCLTVQAGSPNHRGHLTKLSSIPAAIDGFAAQDRAGADIPQPLAASTQTQGLKLSVRQDSDAEAPATFRVGVGQPAMAALSTQNLPPAAAVDGLAIQPADDSAAPAQSTSSGRPTWVPIRRAADSSLSVLC